MQEIIIKIKYFERGLSRCLNKVELFFVLNSVPFNGQGYQKRGLELMTSCSSEYKTSLEKFPLLVIYYWTKFDDII